MIRNKILVVEDEPSIAENIAYALSTEGFAPVCCGTGQEALDRLSGRDIALVVLDIGLPDINGFDLLRRIREDSPVPLIVVTARGAEVDRVVGLEIGADDYVVKPVSPRELTARVRAVLRRSPEERTPAGARGGPGGLPFEIDDRRCSIKYHGKTLDLARYEFRLLRVLVASPGRVYTRDQLMAQISENPDMSMDRTIDTHIKTIRQKLKAVRPDEDPIATHRGFGYSLREPR